MDDLIDITLDPDRLPDVSQEELFQFLEYSRGSSYSNTIDIRETNSFNKLRNKDFFRKNNIINFPYEKIRSTNNDDLDISVFLLIHGGSSSTGTIIKKNHNFWNNNTNNLMFNCQGEEVVGIKANSVRMYNDIGFNVSTNDNIYKILIGVFYFNSLICLILLYLILNLFRSRINNKIYPFKKLYTIGKQKVVIANPLKNINNNSNIQNNEKVIKDDNFHYYIPNISLALTGNSEHDIGGENYVCFVIRHNGILKLYKFVLTYENIVNILSYNNIKSIDVNELLDRLNIADMINIIYNTIQNKILPKYKNLFNLHISFDLIYCKGGLESNNYIITKKKNNKCYKLTNEFGYSYVGHYKNCLSKICDEIKMIGINKRKINVEDYFKKLFDIDFQTIQSSQCTNEFIENLINTEKSLYNTDKKRKTPNDKMTNIINNTFKSDLIKIYNQIQTLQIEDFSQSGSGKKKKKVRTKKKKVITKKKKVITKKKN